MWRDWLARTLKPQINEAATPVCAPSPPAVPAEESRENAGQASPCLMEQQQETAEHASPLD